MLEAETQVLEFRLDLVEAQTVGERGVDVERLAGNLILLVGRLRVQRSHVVQAVADFDEDDAYVVAHGEQQLFEVLGLCRGLFTEDAARDLGESVDNLRNLRPEHVLDVFHRVVGVFNDVVKQGRADARGTQSHLLAGNLSDGDGVHDVRFSRQPLHSLVGLSGEVESFGDKIGLLTMGRGQIAVEQSLKSFVDESFVGLLLLQLLHVNVRVVHILYPPYIDRCSYLTRSFLPARMLLPRMPFFFFKAATVVWLRLAIDESVSPFRTVTLRPAELLFLRLLLFV